MTQHRDKLYGFFSEKSFKETIKYNTTTENRRSFHIYQTPIGCNAIVTHTSISPTYKSKKYNDLIPLGEINNCIDSVCISKYNCDY